MVELSLFRQTGVPGTRILTSRQFRLRAAHLLHSTGPVHERQETPMHRQCTQFPSDVAVTSRKVDAGRVNADIQNIGMQASHAATYRHGGPCRRSRKSANNRGPGCGSRTGANPTDAGWSSQVAREAHNLEVAGSNPVPAIFENIAETNVICYLPAFGSAA